MNKYRKHRDLPPDLLRYKANFIYVTVTTELHAQYLSQLPIRFLKKPIYFQSHNTFNFSPDRNAQPLTALQNSHFR